MKIEDSYYWISADRIFILNYKSWQQDNLSRLLTKDEVDKLPIKIVYTGDNLCVYESNEKETFTIILKIIELMNSMQPEELFYSFPLGNPLKSFSDLDMYCQ